MTPPPANRLAQAASPYLLQHAHHPVDWWPWGDEAFAEARRRDCPVFLSIGYATCHWCHVMEREPFFAGTYFPPVGRGGRPGLQELIPRVVELWSGQRERLLESARAITAELSRAGEWEPAPAPAPKSTSVAWAGQLRSGVERLKFRHDARHGGFHRYSTDVRWRVPHFEKMLYNQALLALAHCEALEDPAASMEERAELRELLPQDKLAVALAAWQVLEEGNWNDEASGRADPRNILHRVPGAETVSDSARDRLESARGRLLAARAAGASPARRQGAGRLERSGRGCAGPGRRLSGRGRGWSAPHLATGSGASRALRAG